MKLFGKESAAICLLDSTDKYRAIVEVVERCSIFSAVADTPSFIRHVIARERLQSTGIGHGVAIAHGTAKGLDRVRIGLGISHDGVEYESFDGQVVHLLFVIASSSDLQLEYLRSLSAILQIVRSEQVRSRLTDIVQSRSEQGLEYFLSMMEEQRFEVQRAQ